MPPTAAASANFSSEDIRAAPLLFALALALALALVPPSVLPEFVFWPTPDAPAATTAASVAHEASTRSAPLIVFLLITCPSLSLECRTQRGPRASAPERFLTRPRRSRVRARVCG